MIDQLNPAISSIDKNSLGHGLSQSGFLEEFKGLAKFGRFLINVLGCTVAVTIAVVDICYCCCREAVSTNLVVAFVAVVAAIAVVAIAVVAAIAVAVSIRLFCLAVAIAVAAIAVAIAVAVIAVVALAAVAAIAVVALAAVAVSIHLSHSSLGSLLITAVCLVTNESCCCCNSSNNSNNN